MCNKLSLRRRQAFRLSILKFGAIAILSLMAFVVGAAVTHGTATHDPGIALSAAPTLALTGLMFRSGDAGGGVGGETAKTPPEPTGDTLEAKLTSAKTLIGNFFKDVGRLTGELAQKTADYLKLQGDFESLKTTAENEKTEHVATKGLLESEKTGHKATSGKLVTAESRILNLEGLCNLKGIDPKQVVPPAAAPVPDSSVSDWNAKLASAKGNAAQMKVLEEFQAAVKACTVKPAEAA